MTINLVKAVYNIIEVMIYMFDSYLLSITEKEESLNWLSLLNTDIYMCGINRQNRQNGIK